MNRAGLFIVIALYIPFVVALAAGLGYAAFWLTWMAIQARVVAAWYFIVPLDIAVALTIVLLLISLPPLFFRRVHPPIDGLTLNPVQHPRLFALLDRICKRLNCRPPDTVLITPDETAGIGDFDIRHPDGSIERAHRVLVLGAALVVHLRADEFATVLCHEIAHAACGDTKLSRFADRFFQSMHFSLYATYLEEDTPIVTQLTHAVLRGYYYLFCLVYAGDSQRREFRADRLGAEICGPQNMRNALIKTHLSGYVSQLAFMKLLYEYAEHEAPMDNLYAEYRRRWRNLPDKLRIDAENRMFMEEPSRLSTHPVLSQRIRALADVPAKEWTIERPATALFGHWETLERRLTDELLPMMRAAFDRHLRQMDRAARLGR